MEPCDPEKKAQFDYSGLDAAFTSLAKPAQRALVSNGILTPAALAGWRQAEVAALHGIGPSVLVRLDGILRAEDRQFR